MPLDFDTKYRATLSRDRRFDGWFVVGVISTGIYCRPSCPTPVHPKPVNVEFFPTAAAAQRRGLRSCKRCRPDAVPGSPELTRRDDLAARALRLVNDGLVDREGVNGLASRLATGVRQLNRAMIAELGASPLELARAQRAHNARVLIETTEISFADIAFAAGFGSIRQFNDTIRAIYDTTPTQLRRRPTDPETTQTGAVTLRLPFRAPFDQRHVFDFHASRTIGSVDEGDSCSYDRWVLAKGGPAHLRLQARDDHVEAEISPSDPADLGYVVNRCRILLDLDTDPQSIDRHLGSDPVLGPLVRRRPGIRSPGCVDPFEAAVRAVVGQQVSLTGARTTLTRITGELGDTVDGTDRRLFPTPEAIAEADGARFGMPSRRRIALQSLASRVAAGTIDMSIGAHPEFLHAELCSIPGIGPWTAGYVSMRGLGHPDVLLAGDLIVGRTASRLGVAVSSDDTGRWAPWRSYATHHLWAGRDDTESEESSFQEIER